MTEKENTKAEPSLLETVAGYLTAADMRYDVDEERGLIHFRMSLDVGNFSFMLEVGDSEGFRRILLFGSSPMKVPPAANAAMVDAINRANYNLATGNFEMDQADGDFRFRSGFILGDAVLTEDMLMELLRNAFAVLDAYMPKFMAVMFGGAKPESVLEKPAEDATEVQDESAGSTPVPGTETLQ